MQANAEVSTVSASSQPYRRMSSDSTLPPIKRDTNRRHLMIQYAVVIFLTILVSLIVSLAIVFTLRPQVIRSAANTAPQTSAVVEEPSGGPSDVDECTAGPTDPCGPKMRCINTYGSYICVHIEMEGSTYVRWGRTNCSDTPGTETVYSGYIGGQFYNQKGGASNYLCLPKDPEWGLYSEAQNKSEKRNFISGTEFEKEGDTPFPFSSKNTDTFNNGDAPCAVCRASSRSSVLMIPARKTCYPGWLLEYSGFLMSESSSDHRTEYICVDKDPEVLGEAEANLDGAGLFLIEANCKTGSLRCPPYEPDKELVCAVCSK